MLASVLSGYSVPPVSRPRMSATVPSIVPPTVGSKVLVPAGNGAPGDQAGWVTPVKKYSRVPVVPSCVAMAAESDRRVIGVQVRRGEAPVYSWAVFRAVA